MQLKVQVGGCERRGPVTEPKHAYGVLHLHAGEVQVARHSRACVAGVAILQLPTQAFDFSLCHLLLKIQINDNALTILHCLHTGSAQR